jgi:hypothetical protein
MGLFSKKSKANPAVEIDGIKIEYDLANEFWQFSHKGQDFVAYSATFVIPSQARLSSILTDIEKLKPEMIQRFSKEVRANDGEIFLVNLTDLQAQDSFEVSWSGGKSWGDMGVDFTIRNHAITDEAWGD